ncbi:Frigida-like protein [Musa troglodytarum]|uniref:FRIGIDA-like protein n=1 Tax=Musa troglodytarum TaxID=320322 RepID=A0A9E7EYI5_9LILI|nr:Frigida-like protein [Musa troglodytarum]
MGSEAAAAIPSSLVQESFAELEKQRELITCCTLLWKELSDHFSTLERGLEIKSEALRSKRQSLDASTRRTLGSLRRRELSIDAAVDIALAKLDERRVAAVQALAATAADGDEPGLPEKLRSVCTKMDFDGFFDLVVAKRKDVELLRSELPVALADCIDPSKFVMNAISGVFPVDKRPVKSPNDLGWACVLILESLVPVLADPELGTARLLVTRTTREQAKEMAEEWKEGLEQHGGVENTKPSDAHTFLQLVVTFGIVEKDDKALYQRLVVSFSWRKQMPKLAISLGLEDKMEDIIEELISNGHQLDAINFAYEAGLQDKFPPVPLLKSFLKDSKKATLTSEDRNNCGQTMNNTCRKEQSVIRAAMKCIQEHKLEAEFPLEGLQKRLEQLEKAKVEKKRPSGGGPANKRTRASNGGPMPPAKAGRLTSNACVSSFPAAPAFVRSPSSHAAYPAAAPYPYDSPAGHGVYGSRSPPALRDSYGYPAEVGSATLGASYPSPPMSYPVYGNYNNGLGGYNNALTPVYQQAFYR